MKKLIFAILILTSSIAYSQLDTIGVGLGEKLNVAFPKVNSVIRLLNTLQLYNDSTGYLERNILDGALVNTTELNRLVGVTSAIQTQLNGKVATTVTVNGHALSGNISVTTTDLSLNNVTNESKATMFTNPTFTGIQKVSTTDTLSTKAYARSVGGGTGSATDTTHLSDRIDLITATINDTLSANTTFIQSADTVSIFTWNVGVGAVTDTASFRNNYHYGSFSWEGSDTLHISKLKCVLTGSSPSVAVQVSWDVNKLDATPTNLNSSAVTITSTTSGDADISFANSTVYPNQHIWLTTPTVTTQPTSLSCTLAGWKQNRKY